MAKLTIRCPGQPDQILDLGPTPVTIGRGENNSVFIAEKKASRRHLSVRLLADGRAVAEDLGSSNGCVVQGPSGEQRFQRRLLLDGDEIHIGATRIGYREAAAEVEAAAAPLVSGTLMLTPAGNDPRPASSEATAAAAKAPPLAAASVPGERLDEGRGGGGRASLKGAVVFCVIAVAALVGVEVLLGARAEKRASRKESHLEALRVLEEVGNGPEAFKTARDEFAERHPGGPESPDLSMLDRYLGRLREQDAYMRGKRAELTAVISGIGVAPASEVRFKLLQLRRDLPRDEAYANRIKDALAGLDRRKAEQDHEALQDLERRVADLLGAKRPSQAARLVASFGRVHEGLDAESHDSWRALRGRVKEAVSKTFTQVWMDAETQKDPAKRRALLADAWNALEGTPQGTQIGDRLRSAASLAAPRRGPGAATAPGAKPGATPAPAVPTVADKLLARARAAEEKLVRRDWVAGRAALAKLVDEVDGGRLQAEWKVRLGEVDQMLGLVKALAEATDAKRKPRRKLTDGSWTVIDANPKEVTLESKKKGTKIFAWSALTPDDTLKLLTPARITADQRHAVAVLAANMGTRQAFVDVLLPLYEKGGDLAATDRLVARHLHGRATPPEGGYRAYKGEILDRSAFDRRRTQERIASLRQEADALLIRIAKDPAFRKLTKLKAMRDELDKRRRYALLAIFNRTHYPYPANKGSKPYQSVQHEIDGRVARVREIWDDPFSIRIKRAGKLAKILGAWDLVIGELDVKQVDIGGLRKSIAPYTMYVTDEPITIRAFYRTKDEQEWLTYGRWVMAAYNPARREEAKEPEAKQVQITNAYRMMLGYTAIVKPGPAAYDSIDRDNVAKILDQGKIVNVIPLRAVRIDNRLTASARVHSEDMARRGYFAHQAPPNPATGEGPTGPGNRMKKQGYHGWSGSENIAQSASPQQAHNMWCHSSGHHRNILSNWTDLGSGVGGRNFTQNFASGGGSKPMVYPDTKIRDRGAGGGRRPRRSQ